MQKPFCLMQCFWESQLHTWWIRQDTEKHNSATWSIPKFNEFEWQKTSLLLIIVIVDLLFFGFGFGYSQLNLITANTQIIHSLHVYHWTADHLYCQMQTQNMTSIVYLWYSLTWSFNTTQTSYRITPVNLLYHPPWLFQSFYNLFKLFTFISFLFYQ